MTAPLALFILAFAILAGAESPLARRVILPMAGILSGAAILLSKGIYPWELF